MDIQWLYFPSRRLPAGQAAEVGAEHGLPTPEAHAHGAAGDVSHHEACVDDRHLQMAAGMVRFFWGVLSLKNHYGLKWTQKAMISMTEVDFEGFLFRGLGGGMYIYIYILP